MEKALRGKEEYLLTISGDSVLEKVLDWLEREDSELERVAGYGLCLASVAYFLAKLAQACF
jgi:hypothetical protein